MLLFHNRKVLVKHSGLSRIRTYNRSSMAIVRAIILRSSARFDLDFAGVPSPGVVVKLVQAESSSLNLFGVKWERRVRVSVLLVKIRFFRRKMAGAFGLSGGFFPLSDSLPVR